MARVRIGPVPPDRQAIDAEIARLRDLDISALRAQWQVVCGGRPPSHLPRHLLFRVLAYRLQATRFGDLDAESQRLLDRSAAPQNGGQRATDAARLSKTIRPGTVLGREWNGQMHR